MNFLDLNHLKSFKVGKMSNQAQSDVLVSLFLELLLRSVSNLRTTEEQGIVGNIS